MQCHTGCQNQLTMNNATDPVYLQARAIKTGTHKLHPVHQQLVDDVSKQFGVRALDFTCSTQKTTSGNRQQVVLVIVETSEDCKKLESQQAALVKLFMPYLLSTDKQVKLADPLKRAIYQATEKPYPEVITGSCALEKLEAAATREKGKNTILLLKEKYPAELHSIVPYHNGQNIILFYHTDKQRAESEANGFTAMLRNIILQELNDTYGDAGGHTFNVFTDSEEAFQRDYKGDWHIYFQ